MVCGGLGPKMGLRECLAVQVRLSLTNQTIAVRMLAMAVWTFAGDAKASANLQSKSNLRLEVFELVESWSMNKIILICCVLSLFGCDFHRREVPAPYMSTSILLVQMEKDLETYKIACGQLPTSLDEFILAVKNKKCANKPVELLISDSYEQKKDGWDNPVFYQSDGDHFRLMSCGAEWMETDSISHKTSVLEIYSQKGRLFKE